MKTAGSVFAFLVLVTMALAQPSHRGATSQPVTVDIKNAQGQIIGTATLSDSPHGVKIKINVKGLPPGEHSLNINQVAKCEPPDFKSAGPYFNGASGPNEHPGLPSGSFPDFSFILVSPGTAH